MASVYLIKDGGKSEPMKVIVCKDEDRELQTILRNNFDLLPGDQIEPDSPCRWLLVKREMPVPDPSTGTDRWSIDFLFLDQNATPTFVECKRYLDTRARREVVGQVMEYAANCQYYWSSDDLRSYAEQTAKEEDKSLGENSQLVQAVLGDSPEDFFKEAERKLRASEIRIIFFLEQAPVELKRLVEYMNAQMTSVEVLLVEARQFGTEGFRIVVPTLYGYTEQIRGIKHAASSDKTRTPVAADWESFNKNAQQRGLEEPTITAMRQVYDACKALQADIAWGKGVATGSFSPKWPTLSVSGSPFSVYSDGKLETHFPVFQNSDAGREFSSKFSAQLLEAQFPLPANYQSAWVRISPETWVPHVSDLIAVLKDVALTMALAMNE